jgi:hypothetical protein
MHIIGYTHSDGYALCSFHGHDEMKDTGNESGHVQPVFDFMEDGYDLTCDVCHEPLMERDTLSLDDTEEGE